jgi:hypothetical protein
MAILRSTVNLSVRGYAALELTPNSPLQRDLVDTYSVRLWVHDQLIYDQVHSVRNWQMRHFYVEEIARAFRHIRELLEKKIECMPDESTDEQVVPSFLSFVHARLDVDWLSLILAATHPKRIGELVHVNIHLRKAEHRIGEFKSESPGQWGEWEELVSATVFCTPEEAVSFGIQLQEEIRQVEQERIQLGIPEYDDED